MRPQQVTANDQGSADAPRQTFGTHAVTHRQNALLKQLALRTVCFFGGVRRNRSRLLGERQVGIAGLIGLLHRQIATEGGGLNVGHSGSGILLSAWKIS